MCIHILPWGMCMHMLNLQWTIKLETPYKRDQYNENLFEMADHLSESTLLPSVSDFL